MRLTPEQRALRATSEKDLDSDLFGAKVGVATLCGWRSYHTLRSKGSAPGFPDRTAWRERVIFAELKTEANPPTDLQVEILTCLARAGAEVYLWRPSDRDEAEQVLAQRWEFWPLDHAELERGHTPFLHRPAAAPWTPRSLWLPQGCRVDER